MLAFGITTLYRYEHNEIGFAGALRNTYPTGTIFHADNRTRYYFE